MKRSKMHTDRGPLAPENFQQRGFITNVNGMKLEQRIRRKRRQMLPFSAAQIVDANDRNLTLKKLLDHVGPKKSGGAGDHPSGTHLVRTQRLFLRIKIADTTAKMPA